MSRLTRRSALGLTATAVAGLGLAGTAYAATASGPANGVVPAAGDGHTGHMDGMDHTGHDAPAPFDEVYQGRRIQGAPAQGGAHGGHHGGYQVRIDGKELHVMRNGDGTWISVINHYETFANPRAVARAAVVELQGATLVPLA
ncbi:tyrosinase cofactor [Streptomyces sp. TLI_146]|uniref:apotyrosinase chaperone MelC1 n=1 Tax=Streptomyces sp. TLI_146 TaxID=1938858 RepID=UPI000C70CF08|nr:tyrosinase cofactor [Streptomyces sp. TLI_146]PKV83994.1 tyrosinase co-factor MelC1 [Streptomyces sp. TLI_146]